MRYGILGLIALLLLEGAARVGGLGSTLIYEKTQYGYRVAPNQSIRRFGKSIYYNDLGLRNDSAVALPSENLMRILCVGDSITFGGTLTDQNQTFPYQLQKLLAGSRVAAKVEVLNASAGGWATENEEGWINTYGTLGATWVVLQVATHDLFQRKTGSEIVGTHPSFPDRQPRFAIEEAVTRYFLPRIVHWSRDPGVEIHYRSDSDVRSTLSSIERIESLVRRSHAKLAVLFVEQPRGIEPTDHLTMWAKEQLFTRLSIMGVPLIRPASTLEQAGGVRLFRDGLHPSEEGNRVLAQEVAHVLQDPGATMARHSAQRRPALEIMSAGGAR